MTALTPWSVEKMCNADMTAKSPWLGMSRRDSSVSLDKPPQLHVWREPFDLWESAAQRRETPSRWTCEACGATGTLLPSELASWSSDAAKHQLTHVTTAFDDMPILRISEVSA